MLLNPRSYWCVACAALLTVLTGTGGCPGTNSTESPSGISPAVPGDGPAVAPDIANGSTPTSGPLAVSGRINPGQAAKRYPRSAGTEETWPYTLVVQSNQTGEVYRGETNVSGDFKIDLPDKEAGNALVITVVAPDGRALGPVLVGQVGDAGVTGVAMDQPADLGTINLPDDPGQQPITAGTDGNAAQLAAPEAYARLNSNGAPVGIGTVGKGESAEIDSTRVSGHADRDHDGLIDIFDADSDGSGRMDDLKPGAAIGQHPSDCQANFFMNLKVGPENAQAYYTGTPEQVAARLKADTVITLEIMTTNVAQREITSVRLLQTPGPAYLPVAECSTGDMQFSLWNDTGYAFANLGNPAPGGFGPRWGVWVRPNDLMQAGDIFTAEITFNTGGVEPYSRMINYVFKSIPRLVRLGAAGNLRDFDVTNLHANGSPGQPILFDGNQDLVLVFNPPKDETGAYLMGMDYHFEIFFEGEGGGQLQVDHATTWPTPVPHLNPTSWYEVRADALGPLAADGTYAVVLPKAALPDVVHVAGGGTAGVSMYKIDIAAQCVSGNAAIMLNYKKN